MNTKPFDEWTWLEKAKDAGHEQGAIPYASIAQAEYLERIAIALEKLVGCVDSECIHVIAHKDGG